MNGFERLLTNSKLSIQCILLIALSIKKYDNIIMTAEGGVAQSVERLTPGEEVVGSIPDLAARCLLIGSVSL